MPDVDLALDPVCHLLRVGFVAVTLAGAIVLTVYSLLVYLYRYRTLPKTAS